MKTYTGIRKSSYSLEDTPFAHGGEGEVYNIEGDSGHVAKIYYPHVKFKTEQDRSQLHEKLKTMLSMNIPAIIDNYLRITWPQDILYENGQFAGYVMPKLPLPYKIYHLTRNDRTSIIPGFTWKYSCQYAYNLSWLVWYLHNYNIVIGDLNMNNIAAGDHGEVILIDCDSFDITNPKTHVHYPCTVGLPELIAPELQATAAVGGSSFSVQSHRFTKESDNFSLAIHLFRLLMNNADPFGAKLIGRNVSSQAAFNINTSIVNGECPYFRTLPNKRVPDWAPKITFLPDDIAEAFRRTLCYTQQTILSSSKNRTTAEEWTRLLFKYASKDPQYASCLKTCSKDSCHIYPAHLAKCPFCDNPAGHETAVSKLLHSFNNKFKGLFGF